MKKSLLYAASLLITWPAAAQTTNTVKTNGNVLSTSDKIGSTNNQDVVWMTNGQNHSILKTNGDFKLKKFDDGLSGIVFSNGSGVFTKTPFTGNANDVLNGTGNFSSLGSLTGWTFSTDHVTTPNRVGINVSNPACALDIVGNAHISGSIQVTGENFFTGKSHFYRIAPMPGDSLIRFGDSTVILDHTNNRIYAGTGSPVWVPAGLGLGSMNTFTTGTSAIAIGDYTYATTAWSMAIGRYVKSNSENAITIGSGGDGNYLQNNVQNSLMVGFNSTVPSLFVGSSSGGTSTGRIGIGTSTPDDKVHIKTGTFSVYMGNALYSGLAYGTSYIGFNAVRTVTGTWKTESDGSNNGGALMYGNVQGDLFFASIPRTGGTGQTGVSDATVLGNTRLYIGADGSVGIGNRCIPTGFKMAVSGKIICESVRVKLRDGSGCWPDYVFGENYHRMSLEELSVYVAQNKHLPGMPDEKTVAAEGVDLLEMNQALLRTLEEHTLYLVELKKENEALKKQVKALVKNK